MCITLGGYRQNRVATIHGLSYCSDILHAALMHTKIKIYGKEDGGPPFNPIEIYLGGLLTYPPGLEILLFRGLGDMLKVG